MTGKIWGVLSYADLDISLPPKFVLINHKPIIGELNVLAPANSRPPAEGVQLGGIHQLARRTIGFDVVKQQLALEASDSPNSFSQVKDCAIHAGADVNMRQNRAGLCTVSFKAIHETAELLSGIDTYPLLISCRV